MEEYDEEIVEAFRQVVIEEIVPLIRSIRDDIKAFNTELRAARVDAELRSMLGL
jgi:hypothetical protein